MKNIIRCLLIVTIALSLMAMAWHKYYVSVFQLNYVPAKKQVQLTSRIFIDDLEAAFVKKYKKNFYLGTKDEIAGANNYIEKYFDEKVQVKLNGKVKPVKFLGKETEDDILICYYTLPAETYIKSVQVNNANLLEMFEEQQNIIHANINGNKKSLLLTNDDRQGLLEF